MDTLNAFTGTVRRCVEDYAMIASGDRVAVGLSGGKDSLVLLAALGHLQRFYPASFALEAIMVDTGIPGMDLTPAVEWCREADIPCTVVKTQIYEIVFDVRREHNPCSLCAKMRRGALNTAVTERGCNKLALGHHFDDAVETFILSLVYEGRLGCFEPVTFQERSGVTLIRPMLYAGERRCANLATALALPVCPSTCPMDKTSRRREAGALLDTISAAHPDIRSRVFGAMQRLPLPGWKIKPPDAAEFSPRKERKSTELTQSTI